MNITTIKNSLLLIRPYQWVKNIFVFLPLFFSGDIVNIQDLLTCSIVFAAFCAISSSIYCINDILDVDVDKLHPIKKNRPIASDKISKLQGFITSLVMFCLSASFLFLMGEHWAFVSVILLLYYLLNITYCLYLKRKSVIDVFCIAVGYVLRILAGGISTGINISHWIILMTFLLSLFLAVAKRRDDVIQYENTGIIIRDTVNRYNSIFLNQALCIIASITIVCYIMYTVSDQVVARVGSSYLYSTSIFVLAGIIRYLQLVIVDKLSNPTIILLKDKFIQCCIIGWILLFTIILYA